jgi:hypothetical protein
MRHNYVGDEGDYAKLALLRVLQRRYTLGVNWYLTIHPEGEGHSSVGDGNLLAHLTQPGWDALDANLLKRMRAVFAGLPGEKRHLDLLEDGTFLPGATFFQEALPTGEVPLERRVAARQEWHEDGLAALAHTELVFVDPDNGFETASLGKGSKTRCKYANYREVAGYLRRGQAVVAYQHRPRATWDAVIAKVLAEIAEYEVPTASPGFIAFGSRGFFLMHPDESIVLQMTADALAMQERLAEAGFRKLKIAVHLPDTWGGLDDQLAERMRESLAEWQESTNGGATTA